MTDRDRQPDAEGEEPLMRGLERHQVTAAASPRVPLKQRAAGNFRDLEMLLEHLGEDPVFELGKPLPNDRFMPKSRVGNCPASHNRFLLDD